MPNALVLFLQARTKEGATKPCNVLYRVRPCDVFVGTSPSSPNCSGNRLSHDDPLLNKIEGLMQNHIYI